MAWEWVAPVATGVAGIAGMAFTYWSGRDGRTHAERVAQRAATHAGELAHEALQQERLSQAYLAVLAVAADWLLWSFDVRPLWVTGNQDSAQPPEGPEQKRAGALLAAYGSTPARAKYEEFLDAVRAVVSAAEEVAIAEQTASAGAESGIDRAAVLKKLHNELKPAVRRLHEELERLVAAELGQPPPAPTIGSPARAQPAGGLT